MLMINQLATDIFTAFDVTQLEANNLALCAEINPQHYRTLLKGLKFRPGYLAQAEAEKDNNKRAFVEYQQRIWNWVWHSTKRSAVLFREQLLDEELTAWIAKQQEHNNGENKSERPKAKVKIWKPKAKAIAAAAVD